MKNKRFGGASLTHTAAATPAQATSDMEEGEGAEGEGDPDAEEEEDNKRREPEMYRWVSNAAGLSFSVPVGILPSTPEDGGDGIIVDSSISSRPSKEFNELRSTPAPLPLCDVRNCGEVRKYRLVSDWEKGACGMVHLKVLQGRSRSC
jgi:Ino eighty subunit 2